MATTPNAPPSRDPANGGSLLGMANELLRKHLQGVDDMLPARIVSYDRATNRAQVVPVIRILTTDGRQIERAQIASVPVMWPGGGGFILNFPLNPGDLGWIKANDRDISLFLQTFKTNAPNSLRLHSFQDAVFIPHPMTGYSIAGEDAAAAVLQSLDGSVKVSVGAGGVVLAAGAARVEVSPAGITLDGVPVIINGIDFATHVHTGVQPGGGNTGGPV